VSERVIPIISQPLGNLPIPEPSQAQAWAPGQQLIDQRKRPLRDLRISVRPLQFSVQLLHAQRNFQQRLCLFATQCAA